jgi:hypothetical protein
MLRTTVRRLCMNKPSLRFALSTTVALAGLVGLFACATDNGDSVHGPQFGPIPDRPDGSLDDGQATDEGGSTTSDAEAGTDAPNGDGALPPCTSGTVAVLAGNDSSLSGAIQQNGGAWTGAAIAGGAAKSAPSLVAFGTGFLGLTRGAGDALQSVTFGTSWSGASAVGALVTLGSPSIAVVATKAQAVFLSGPDTGTPDAHKFFRIENAATTWSAADPVTAAGNPSFGPSAAPAAAAGNDLVIAQDGDNAKLYTQDWSGTWAPAVQIADPVVTLKSAPPALVSVTGTFDLVLLYAQSAPPNTIGFATRDATTKMWSAGAVTQDTAQTAEQMSVTRLSATTLLVAFRGNNGRPYTMTGTIGASSITWGLPSALLADTSTVDSAPAVAPGVCGNDAIAVFASGGIIKATEYRGTTWSVPGTVAGASGSRVSVATR